MDQYAEALIRATIHDLANCLSGAQGILDLSDPAQPLSPLERGRLESVLSDGMTILARSRHLALTTLPEGGTETPAEWRAQLQRQLTPLSSIFRCSFELLPDGESAGERWPGELLRDYTHAITRVLLPYVQGGSMKLRLKADERGWHISWSPVSMLAESLNPAATRPRDVTSRWALQLAASLGAKLTFADRTATAEVPKF